MIIGSGNPPCFLSQDGIITPVLILSPSWGRENVNIYFVVWFVKQTLGNTVFTSISCLLSTSLKAVERKSSFLSLSLSLFRSVWGVFVRALQSAADLPWCYGGGPYSHAASLTTPEEPQSGQHVRFLWIQYIYVYAFGRRFYPSARFIRMCVSTWFTSRVFFPFSLSMMWQLGVVESKSATFPIEKPRHLLDDSFLESQSPARNNPHSSSVSNGISIGTTSITCARYMSQDLWVKITKNLRFITGNAFSWV